MVVNKDAYVPVELNYELKMARINAGMSAKDVAALLGKSPAWVSRVEKGTLQITERVYHQIKSIYNVSEQEMPYSLMAIQNSLLRKISFLQEENMRLRSLLLLYGYKDQKSLDKCVDDYFESAIVGGEG